MSKTFFQEASHAAAYALYRPSYTADVADVIMGNLRRQLPVQGKWNYLVDVGCGSGQSTHLFFPHFRRILALDPSANQIAEAKKKYEATADHVTFSSGVAEKLDGVESTSVDLIVAGQAAHWFHLPDFLAECRRTLVPGGLVALFGYATPVIGTARQPRRNSSAQLAEGPSRGIDLSDDVASQSPRNVVDPNNDVNARLIEFYRAIDWPSDRVHVETRYERLLLDSSSGAGDLIGWREEALTTLTYDWPLDSFVKYLSTWSGYRRSVAKDESNVSLLRNLATDVMDLNDRETICVDFDVFVVYYRKNACR